MQGLLVPTVVHKVGAAPIPELRSLAALVIPRAACGPLLSLNLYCCMVCLGLLSILFHWDHIVGPSHPRVTAGAEPGGLLCVAVLVS